MLSPEYIRVSWSNTGVFGSDTLKDVKRQKFKLAPFAAELSQMNRPRELENPVLAGLSKEKTRFVAGFFFKSV